MFAPLHHRLRRRLSVPTSGSARRRARERQRAQLTRTEGERLARERREIRAREKVEQQRQAREELASYEPWGRAGGGAPNPHGVRYSDLRSTGIYPEDELKGLTLHEGTDWRFPVRRRRRTPASLRLREDPQTCYAEHLRKTVDNDIRYRQTPDQQHSYKQILDEMVEKRKKAVKEETRQNIEFERQMHKMEGPWGKPGPGGTTWRNPRDIGLNFSKSMGWTDNNAFSKLKGDHRRYKGSSLTLPQVKKDDDYKEDDKDNKENEKPSNIDKLPEIKNDSGPKEISPQETRKNSNNEIDSKKTATDRKGKRSSNKNKFVKRLSNGDRVKRVVPDDDMNSIVKTGDVVLLEKKLTPESAILRLTGGVELVPLLARRRRVGARTLPSSDVTRPPEQSCQWREILNVDYLRELKSQMRAKYQQKEESRRDSAESVRQHHSTWASLWGRPGHGAPQRGRYARSNLAQLLYVAPLTNAQ